MKNRPISHPGWWSPTTASEEQTLDGRVKIFFLENREAISGSELNAQKSEKLADFWANFWTPIWRILCQNYIKNSHFLGCGTAIHRPPRGALQLDASWSWNCSLFHSERTRKSKFSEEKWLMSHSRQPPFWNIFLIPSGFLPRGNAQNLCKSPILRTKSTSSKGLQSEKKEQNFSKFENGC